MDDKHIALTDHGCLPAGTDVNRVLSNGYQRELVALWDTHHYRDIAQRVLSYPHPEGSERGVAIWAANLNEVAEVTALDALAANARLVERFTEGRWSVMWDARQAGASWAQIGEALGMSKQGAADWYQRKTEQHQLHLLDTHDNPERRNL